MGVNNVKVAIVGAGNMAGEHIRAFSSLGDVSITGIFSRTQSRAQALAEKFDIPVVADSLDSLHRTAKPDIVIITVNAQNMLETVVAALEYRWTVLAEKPAGYNLQQATQLHEAARTAKSKTYVALNRRFLSSTEYVLRGLDESPRFIHVQDQQSLELAESLGHPPEIVENWMYANSIHLIDYFSLFGRGAVTKVTNISEWNGLDTPLMLSHIRFSSGDEGLYQGIWSGPGPWAVTVNNTEQRWEMRPLEQATLQKAGSRDIQSFDQTPEDRQFKPGFYRQAQELVKAHKGADSLCVTLGESLKSMTLVSRIFNNA